VLFVISIAILLFFEVKALNFLNVSPMVLIAVWVNTLFSPYNKIVSTAFTLPNVYLKFVFVSVLRNLLILLFVVLAVLLGSEQVLLFSIAIAESFISLIVTGMKRTLTNESPNQIIPLEKITLRGQISVTVVTIYFELIAKFDFFIFSLFLNPTAFGLYALLSNVNESFHAYLATIRTQITPNFTNVASVHLAQQKQLLHFVKLMLLLIGLVGFAFVHITFSVKNNDLTNWPFLLCLLLVSTVVMFKTLVFGGVYIQRGKSDLLAHFATAHLLTLFATGSLSCLLGGVELSLLSSILVNFIFSAYISKRIPGQRVPQ